MTALGYRTDLAIRRAEGGQTADHGDHIVIRSPQNPGFRWGNFVLLSSPPLPGELAGWLGRFESLFPGGTYKAFGVDVTGQEGCRVDVFAKAGFETQYTVVLTAASLRESRGADLETAVRQLAGDEDWRQSAELREACADRRQTSAAEAEPDADGEFESRRLAARRRLTEAGLGAWFGAFADGRLVAQLGLVPVGGGDARYQDVETHPDFRRRGLAGRLICLVGRRALADPGVSRLVIVADPGYHAVRLYESLGFGAAEDQVGFVRVV